MTGRLKDLELSLKQGFIDKNLGHVSNFRPRLLINNQEKGEYVLTSLLEEFDTCQTFFINMRK